MVTWHQLGVAGLVIIGLLLLAFGGLATFAGMMSDAPQAGDSMSKKGCAVVVVGIVLVVVAAVWGVL